MKKMADHEIREAHSGDFVAVAFLFFYDPVVFKMHTYALFPNPQTIKMATVPFCHSVIVQCVIF